MTKTFIIIPCLIFAWFLVPVFCRPHWWGGRFFLASFIAVACAWTFEDMLIKLGMIG